MDFSHLKTLAMSETGFVFDPRTGHSYTVNPSGLVALAALRDGRTLDEAVARVREAFDADGEPLDDHVEGFVALLRELGLVAPVRS